MKLNAKEKRIFLKCAEELNELAVELLQAVNKPKNDNYKKILEESSDVEGGLSQIKQIKTND